MSFRLAHAWLGVIAVLAVALGFFLAIDPTVGTRPDAEGVARTWLDAVRVGDGAKACSLLDTAILIRIGGSDCPRLLSSPHPMHFRIGSIERHGRVFSVVVIMGGAAGTIDVAHEDAGDRIVGMHFVDAAGVA